MEMALASVKFQINFHFYSFNGKGKVPEFTILNKIEVDLRKNDQMTPKS